MTTAHPNDHQSLHLWNQGLLVGPAGLKRLRELGWLTADYQLTDEGCAVLAGDGDEE